MSRFGHVTLLLLLLAGHTAAAWRASLFSPRAVKPATLRLETSGGNNNNPSVPPSRGGGGRRINTCADSDVAIAAKLTVSAALETTGLLGVLAAATALGDKFGKSLASLYGLNILQWMALLFVIFSPSTVKTWIDGGVSVATNQVNQPNVVPGNADWYSKLAKPWYNPPGWVFPIMWLIVSKPTQLLAVSKLIKSTSPKDYWPLLTVYCAHLSMGDAWNEVFFGCQRPRLGAFVISTFFALLLTTTVLFYDVNPTIGYLMLPTCAWVFVATCLNWSIYRLNRKA